MKIKYNILLLVLPILLACASCKPKTFATLELSNPLSSAIDTTVVQYPYDSIATRLGGAEFHLVLDSKEIPYQISQDYQTGQKVLLFPISFAANQMRSVEILEGKPQKFDALVHGQVHPERADDFAWENNREGYRVFGPALQARGEISCGVDVFSKRTNKIVLNKWYKDEISKVHTYHVDRGEGMDFYAVGHSLGAGSVAPLYKDKLVLAKNYTKVTIFEQGLLRLAFKLEYAPVLVGKDSVSESKTVICDAYSNLNKYIVKFNFSTDSLNVAMGCVERGEKEPVYLCDNSGLLAYAQPEIASKGIIFTGLLSLKPFESSSIMDSHLLGLLKISKTEPLVFYAGSAWNKSHFKTFAEWTSYLKARKALLENPIKINLK